MSITLIGVGNIALVIVIIMRMFNLTTLCNFIESYYSAKDETSLSGGMCSEQLIKYVIWIVLEISDIGLKSFSAFFSFKAHMVIRKRIKSHDEEKEKD